MSIKREIIENHKRMGNIFEMNVNLVELKLELMRVYSCANSNKRNTVGLVIDLSKF